MLGMTSRFLKPICLKSSDLLGEALASTICFWLRAARCSRIMGRLIAARESAEPYSVEIDTGKNILALKYSIRRGSQVKKYCCI